MNDSALEPKEELLETGEGSGIELEMSDLLGLPQEILRPFDPEKIKVARATKTISLLLTRIEHGEIDLAPDFQRRARIWSEKRKSLLIESLLLKIPLPVFYVAADENDCWAVVDGVQRLTTIYDFCKDEIALTNLEYLKEFEGVIFSVLPRNMQRRIEETELVINVIEPGTSDEVMFNIFKRINTGGLALNAQEIRHALNKGPVRKFLEDIAGSEVFLKTTDGSISDLRMAARECVLRFSAFWLTDWRQYGANDLDRFLGSAMKDINELDHSGREDLRRHLERSMKAAFAIFHDDAFRKRYDINAGRAPISKALFEAWTVNLAKRTDEELDTLVERSTEVRADYLIMMNEDIEFASAISASTGAPGRVVKRFEAIEELLDGVLE